MVKDQWKGRQLYPKDTVSQKKLDRQTDRLDKRIDHAKGLFGSRIRALEERVRALEE